MRHPPNQYRIREGRYGSDDSYGCNGAFVIPTPWRVMLYVMCSDGEGWEHVSVSAALNPPRCPTWAEMCFVKALFWGDDETVVQFHPTVSEYVNFHEFTLHLWRKASENAELPPSWMVGPKAGG